MANFGDTPVTSAFPSPNVLFAATSGQALQQGRQNELMLERSRQEIGLTDQEQVARASAYIDTLPEDQRPAAYDAAVRDLQARGFAKQAPGQYPGHDVIKRLASMGTSSEKLGERAGNTAALGAYGQSLGIGRPAASAAPVSGGGGALDVPPDLMPHFEAAAKEQNIPVPVLLALAKQESDFGRVPSRTGDGQGVMQVLNSTAANPGYGMQGADPAALKDPAANIRFGAQYLRAKAGPDVDFNDPAQRDKALAAYNGGGDPNYVANVGRYLPGQAVAAAGTPAGRPALAGGVQVAGPGGPAAPGAAAPALPPNGLTDRDTQEIGIMLSRPGAKLEQVQAEVDRRRAANVVAVERARQHGREDASDLNAGVPAGYRMVNGKAERIPGLPAPPDASPPGYRQVAGDPNRMEFIPGGPADPSSDSGKAKNQQFQQENTLRDEFSKLTADFRIVQTSYENIRTAAKANDGAGDMSMLYSYVRLLDPTSVVRESEFATAAASGSFGERVQGAVARVLSGARMPESLRESFVRESKNLYETQRKSHDDVADKYERLATKSGLDPEKVVTRYTRPQDTDTAMSHVKTAADYDKIAPGAEYMDPDGHTRRKPK